MKDSKLPASLQNEAPQEEKTNPAQHKEQQQQLVLDMTMVGESAMRLSVAGFGGVLAGWAVMRQRKFHPDAASKRMMQQQRQQRLHSNLPTTWAVACVAFVGVLEFVRLTSPTGMLLEAVRAAEKEETPKNDKPSWQHDPLTRRTVQTMGDYALGGACAGALFRGSAIQAANTMNRGAASPLPIRTGVAVGFVPGLLLGLVAGSMQSLLQFLEYQVDMAKQENDKQENDTPKQQGEGSETPTK